MGIENELGKSCQTDQSDDVLNLLEESETSMTLSDIYHASGNSIDLPDIKRAVEKLEAEGDVIVSGESDKTLRVRLS